MYRIQYREEIGHRWRSASHDLYQTLPSAVEAARRLRVEERFSLVWIRVWCDLEKKGWIV